MPALSNVTFLCGILFQSLTSFHNFSPKYTGIFRWNCSIFSKPISHLYNSKVDNIGRSELKNKTGWYLPIKLSNPIKHMLLAFATMYLIYLFISFLLSTSFIRNFSNAINAQEIAVGALPDALYQK